jgi:nicotinamidase-related amidase
MNSVSPRALIEGRPALLVLEGADQYRPFSTLLQIARQRRVPLICTAADQWSLAAGVSTASAAEHWIQLPCLSAFLGTSLSLLLMRLNVQTLIVAGGRTSVEVHYTFVDAHQNDFHCRVAEDCMAGHAPAAHEAALKAMEYMQTGARQRAASLVSALDAIHEGRAPQ